jgi:hypothetical protein
VTRFFVTPDGVYEEYEDQLFKGLIKVSFPIHNYDKDAGDTLDMSNEKIEEKIKIVFPKIPINLFQEALAFLEWCYKEKRTEGFLTFHLLNNKWSLGCPEQWNGATSVCYHPELREERGGLVGDIHSHPKFSSSAHSHTDSLDERKNAGLFMVVKDFSLMNCEPDIRGVVRGTTFQIKPKYVFSMAGIKDEANPDDPEKAVISFPDEWKERVHVAPCEQCKRVKDAGEKNVKETKEKEEKEKRLIPKRLLEAWRKSLDGKPFGAEIIDYHDRWAKDSKYNGHLVCPNYGCGKFVRNLECPECKKTLTLYEVAKMFAELIDETDCFAEMKGDLKKLEAIAEFFEKQAAGSTATGTSSTPAHDHAHDHDTKRIIVRPAAKDPDDTDIILIVDGDKCEEDCRFRKEQISHQHIPNKSQPIVGQEPCQDKECAEMGHVLIMCKNVSAAKAARAAEMKDQEAVAAASAREASDDLPRMIYPVECSASCNLAGQPHTHGPRPTTEEAPAKVEETKATPATEPNDMVGWE